MKLLHSRTLLGVCSMVALLACDNAANAINKVRRPLDPIVGTWREISTSDTAKYEEISFLADGTYRAKAIWPVPPQDSLLVRWSSIMQSIPATYAKGDEVIVITIDGERLQEGMRRLFPEDLKEQDSSKPKKSLDMVFRYKLGGDVLELTNEERDDTSWMKSNTMRFIRKP